MASHSGATSDVGSPDVELQLSMFDQEPLLETSIGIGLIWKQTKILFSLSSLEKETSEPLSQFKYLSIQQIQVPTTICI